MKTPEGPKFIPVASALAQIGLPFLLQTGEPFIFIPHADVVFGVVAANN